MHRFLIGAAILSGCYSPSYQDCQFQCSSANTCPDGLECTAGLCRLEGLSGACVGGNDDGGGSDSGSGSDSDIDAPPDETLWSAPVEMTGMGNMGWSSPTLSPDHEEMFIESSGGAIFRTTQTAVGTGDTWNVAVLAAGVTAPANRKNMSPHLTRDGLGMYFGSDRDSATLLPDIYRQTRQSLTDPSFGTIAPVAVPALNLSDKTDSGGSLTSDGQIIFFTSDRGTNVAIYQATVNAAAPNTWDPPVRVVELDSAGVDAHPSVSGDGLTIVFTSNRLGADFDIYIATRPSTGVPFGNPRRIPALSLPVTPEVDPWISEDGRVIYLGIGIASNRKIYRSTRL